MKNLILTCPQCSSDQTQKLSVIVDSNTNHSEGVSHGVGIAKVNGNWASGSTVTFSNSTVSTGLAKKLESPKPRGVFNTIFGGILGFIVIGFLIIPFILPNNTTDKTYGLILLVLLFGCFYFSNQ